MTGGALNKRARRETPARLHVDTTSSNPQQDSRMLSYDEHDALPVDEGDIETGNINSSSAVARKRELERQRRNLVNMRFAELDRALVMSVGGRDAPNISHPARRIDREAILKDATARIAVLTAELALSKERLNSMEAEVQSLRTEKIELRADKTYLHSELNESRAEAQRLRKDNIHLWQAIRSSGGLKSVLNADVAKIPVDILLRAQLANNSHHNATAALPHHLHEVAHGQDLRNVSDAPAHRTLQSGRPERPDTEAGVLADSFLVFQSPEELGELISAYQDPEIPVQHHAQSQIRLVDRQEVPTQLQQPPLTASTAQQIHGSDMQCLQDSGQNGHEAGPTSHSKHGVQEYGTDDFLDDIAYCA
jgi:hypothetical protein